MKFKLFSVDPCFESNNLCKNGATCTRQVHEEYICTCALGYFGTNCEKGDYKKPLKIFHSCFVFWVIVETLCSVNECFGNGICSEFGTCESDDAGNFLRCTCDSLHKGRTCSFVRKCSLVVCQNGGTCVEQWDEENVFICKCQGEYIGQFCQFGYLFYKIT